MLYVSDGSCKGLMSSDKVLRRFYKVLQGSRRFKKGQGSIRFNKFLRGSRRFYKVLDGSRRLKKVQEVSRFN